MAVSPEWLGSSEFRRLRKRVLSAIPDWDQWPRVLRLMLVSLPDSGSSDLALEDWCKRRGFDWPRVQKQIAESKGFQSALSRFRSTGQLPSRSHWRNGLTKAHLQIMISESESFGQYLDLLDLRASGQSGKMATDVTSRMGWSTTGDPVDEQPEVKVFSGKRVSGMIIEDEDVEMIRDADAEDEALNSLSDWADFDDLADTAYQEQTLP